MALERRQVEFRVGLTVIAALLILIFGVIWGKNYRFAQDQHRLSFLFQNTGGLRLNDPVSVNGVRKGHVTAIALERGLVRVEISLSREVELNRDYRAYITTVELMGGKKVEIMPGSSNERLDLDSLTSPLAGTQTAGFAEMLVGVSEVATHVIRLTARLDTALTMVEKLLDESTVRQPLIASIADLQATTAALRDLVVDNDVAMRRSLANIDYATGEVRDVLQDRRLQLDSTLTAIHHSAQKMEKFSSTLEDISRQLENREGNLSQLIYGEELSTNLRSTLAKVDSAATELRNSLGRFLSTSNFSLINVLSF